MHAKRNKNSPSLSPSNLESYFSNASLGKEGFKGLDSPCCLHIHSRRYRLCDADGISAKAVIDGFVLSGLLSNDSTEFVKEVSYSQEKITKDKEEETIITIRVGEE